MKIIRGEYGYRDRRRAERLAVTAALAGAILIQLLIRHFMGNSSLKVLLTVTAILTVLPMANIASPLLASWRYRTPERSFYERIHAYEEKSLILYDLVLTTREQIIPLDAIAVHPLGVFGYCPEARLDEKKAEKGLNALFAANKLDPNIRIFKDEGAFLRRLDSLGAADAHADDGTVEYEARTLKSLTM